MISTNTMEYRINGIIKFYPITRLKLEKTVNFCSLSGARITLNSADDGDLAMEITLEAERETDAKEMAAVELNRICCLLSYFCDIPILGSQITRMVSTVITSEGKHDKVEKHWFVADTVRSVVKDLEQESIEELVSCLERKYHQDFEDDIVYMWRDAISQESEALKYLLLHRLLERLFENDRKTLRERITKWIRCKEPAVQRFRSPPDAKYKVTVYTYLRDHIHPKRQKTLPMQDIKIHLPRLKNLVKQAIEEKYGLISPPL